MEPTMEPNDTPAEAGTVNDSAASDAVDTRSTRDALADILDDPETDTGETEAHADDADPYGDADAEDSGNEADAATPNEPEVTGGRFVEHTARVKLADGTTTTVEELKKGYLRQSDYTRKRQEDAELRKSLDGEKQRVGQTAQQLQTQLDRMTTMLEQWKPQRPQVSYDDDPLAWSKYQAQMSEWQEWEGRLGAEAKQVREKQDAEMQATIRDRYANEQRSMVEKFPAMADPEKRQRFFNEATSFMAQYGFGKQDVEGIGDHRLVLVIRDLMRAQRLVSKAPEVAQKVQEKPKMVRGGKRGSDPAQDAKRSRIERLRETGSRADGRRALMDLDL